MSCFPCFQSQKSKKANNNRSQHNNNAERSVQYTEPKAPESKKPKPAASSESKKVKEETPRAQADESRNINAQTFTFRELATATKNFRQECLLGEGGFGRVYKGTLQSTNQVVAVKQLDRNGLQGNKEFLVEVMMLSLLNHPNLVTLIGYCADGDQRLLVNEFMKGGSVEDHLLGTKEDHKPLDWVTRIKIALGAAQGLEYLHDKANPPIIFRDLKSSNILLDENFVPKLNDFGLAKLGPPGDKMPVSSRVMGTYGYVAPEYARSSQLTIKSDVYSFGVVLLELITGRRVIDNTRPVDEQNLISWAQPIFKDPKQYPSMADPLLKKRFSEKGLNQAVAIASMCLQEEAGARPLISDVVTALTFLSKDADDIPLPVASPVDDENVDDEEYTDEEDEYSDEYNEDSSYYDDEEESGEIEDTTEAGSSNQQDEDSSVSKDEIQKSSSRRSSSKGSEVRSASSRKKSKKLKHASTEKSRSGKADGSESSLSGSNRSKSLNVTNQKTAKKAKDGSGSTRSKSRKKSKRISIESSRHKSINKTSSTLQASAEESQNTTRELPDETAPTS